MVQTWTIADEKDLSQRHGLVVLIRNLGGNNDSWYIKGLKVLPRTHGVDTNS